MASPEWIERMRLNEGMDARVEHEKRVANYGREAERLRIVEKRISFVRLALFLVGAFFATGTLYTGRRDMLMYAAFATVPFALAVILHAKNSRRLRAAEERQQVHVRHLARHSEGWRMAG